MKKIILLSFILIYCNCIFAQPDSLLKQFKYRIDNFRGINFSLDGGSQFYNRDLISGGQTNSSSGGSAAVTYFLTKSTDKVLLNASAGFSGSYSTSKEKDFINTNKSRGFFSSPQFIVLNKWFSKKLFTELGGDVSANLSSNRQSGTSPINLSKNNLEQYATTLTLGIGKGRLENVTDMQNALWLYKELKKIDRLSAILTSEDLLALGKSITKGNNTRVLDARKRTQFLLTAVDNYLQEKKAIDKTDITYFSNLNDILFFAFNSPRLSGMEKFIRLMPAITGSYINQLQNNGIDKFKHDFTSRSAVLSTGFKKYSPKNLVHQNNYGASLKLTYIDTDLTDTYFTNGTVTNEITGNTTIKQAGANLFFEHAIYPNTRTAVNFNFQSDLGYQDIDPDKFYAAASFLLSANYFVSYRTRLNFNALAFYRKNILVIDRYVGLYPNSFQLSASAGVQVSL